MTAQHPGPRARQSTERRDAVLALRDLILAGEAFRAAVAMHFGAGIRETEAVSYLRVHGPLTPAQLAKDLHLTSGTVTNLLERLEHRNLAHRRPHPTDRRSTLVDLTEHAHALADTTRDWMDDCIAVLADPEAARHILQALAGQLRARASDVERTRYEG